MKSLTVFDPAAADNTGAGDSTPVPELIRFASDAEWLKRKGVAVERWNLVSDPMEFALNHRVSMFLKRHGAEEYPDSSGERVSRKRCTGALRPLSDTGGTCRMVRGLAEADA